MPFQSADETVKDLIGILKEQVTYELLHIYLRKYFI